jgi:hypothetical protein
VELIYEIISSHPGYFAWAFGLVNVAWGIFLYFNRKEHDKDLEKLRHQHTLDLQKRSKMYELKTTQFQNYFRLMDEFSRKHRSDFSEKFQPLLDRYMQDYLEAESRNDKSASTQAITQFASSVGRLTAAGHEEYLAMKEETNSLRLIASDEVIALLDQVQVANDSALAAASEMMNKYVQLVVTGDRDEIEKQQLILYQAGETTTGLRASLMEQMRKELSEI